MNIVIIIGLLFRVFDEVNIIRVLIEQNGMIVNLIASGEVAKTLKDIKPGTTIAIQGHLRPVTFQTTQIDTVIEVKTINVMENKSPPISPSTDNEQGKVESGIDDISIDDLLPDPQDIEC